MMFKSETINDTSTIEEMSEKSELNIFILLSLDAGSFIKSIVVHINKGAMKSRMLWKISSMLKMSFNANAVMHTIIAKETKLRRITETSVFLRKM